MPLKPLTAPDSVTGKIKGGLSSTLAFIFLFPTLMLGNLLQMTSLIIRPFSLRYSSILNRWIANTWWGWCDSWVGIFYNTTVDISGDDIPNKENAIVLSNHQDMSDIPVIFRLARRKKRLGDLKWFVKDSLKYFPGVGWGMYFLDCLFIKRNWTSDKGLIKSVFASVLKNKIPLWVVTFAEGTRVKPHKIEASQKFAAKRNLPKLNHVLLPRTKGFVATCEGLGGHVDAVYDLTIGYETGVPTIFQWSKGYVKNVHLHVKRFSLNELPKDNQELSDWLINLYVEKDKLLEDFYQNGKFPDAT